MCVAANATLDDLDLSWNCFRSRSAVALIKGLEVTSLSTHTHSLSRDTTLFDSLLDWIHHFCNVGIFGGLVAITSITGNGIVDEG